MYKDKLSYTKLKKYFSLFDKARLYWFSLFLIPSVEVFISAKNAVFYQKIINAVTDSNIKLFNTALWDALIILVLSILKCFITYMYMYQIRQIMARLRIRVMRHLFQLPTSYFERHHTADSIQKLCFNVEDIKTSLANRHSQIITPLITGIAAIVMILVLDLRIGLMVLLLSAVSIHINMLLSKPLHNMAVKIQKLNALCTERLTDILAGIDVIKMFSGSRGMLERYSNVNAELAVDTMKRFRKMSDIQAVEWGFGFLCNIVILLIGIFMSFAGMIDFGTVVAILSLQGMVSLFLSNIGNAWGSLIDAFVLADRVFEILDQPINKRQNSCGASRLSEDDIAFDDVELKTFPDTNECGIIIDNIKFSYDASEMILNGVNIKVDRGKMAALVGESGGGKSTIIKLLLGFYQLNSGNIQMFGKPLSEYTLEELRKNIAYVPQDAYLFTTSIRENIRYGRLDASDEEIVEAAKRAYAHDFIMAFRNGYDTLVGERGESLSGGQRQRIAIARAFIRNAPILLLDEATSALDTESEQFVQKGIEALMGGRTTIVVAHRLSTIEKADIIYVIENGKICENGKHEDLIKRNGVYKNLIELSKSNIYKDKEIHTFV